MKIGIIGAGKVGCSMGKYMVENGLSVAGYLSRSAKSSEEAGTFTGTKAFQTIHEMMRECDVLCIATPDDVIGQVWKQMQWAAKEAMEEAAQDRLLEQKTICHFSGSYSSDVFSNIEATGAYACSVHPMSAFSDKFTAYQQLKQTIFTVEGDGQAVSLMEQLIGSMGNTVLQIQPQQKTRYHCSAALVSNFMIGLFQTGLELLEDCGIPQETGRRLFAPLVAGNIQNMLENGPAQALTGPVERGDVHTVEKHLAALTGDNREIYRLLGKKLVLLAEEKNAGRDYQEVELLFEKTKEQGE